MNGYIKQFFKDLRKEGLRYAIAYQLWVAFEESKVGALRRLSDKCYDYSYGIYLESLWAEKVEGP